MLRQEPVYYSNMYIPCKHGCSRNNEKMFYASFILWHNFELGARKQLVKQLNITQWNRMEFHVMQLDLLIVIENCFSLFLILISF